jgi:hypothetical protein
VSRVRVPPAKENTLPEPSFDPFLESKLKSDIVNHTWGSHLRTLSALRLLQAAAALHLFQLERGTLPGSLNELFPTFLEQVPLDPFSPEQPLKYRLTGDHVLLYSVGSNGKDDGGVPMGLGETNKDDIILRDLDLKN